MRTHQGTSGESFHIRPFIRLEQTWKWVLGVQWPHVLFHHKYSSVLMLSWHYVICLQNSSSLYDIAEIYGSMFLLTGQKKSEDANLSFKLTAGNKGKWFPSRKSCHQNRKPYLKYFFYYFREISYSVKINVHLVPRHEKRAVWSDENQQGCLFQIFLIQFL